MRLIPEKQLAKAVKNWWIHLIIGGIFVGVGLQIWQTPEASYYSLSRLFATILPIVGIAQIYYSVSNRKLLVGWSWYLSNGTFDLIVGFILLSKSIISPELLPYFIGLWLTLKGINGVSLAIDIKEYGVKIWWWMLVAYIIIGVLGVFVVINPIASFASLALLTSGAFVFLGLAMIGSAMHIRQLHKLPQKLFAKATKA